MQFLSQKFYNSSCGINRSFLVVLSFTIKLETLPDIRGTDNHFLNHLLIAEGSKSSTHELQLSSEKGMTSDTDCDSLWFPTEKKNLVPPIQFKAWRW